MQSPNPNVLQLPPSQQHQPAEFGQSGGRVPPHSLEAEQSVLGAILLDNEAINQVLDVVTPEDFYKREHQVLFDLMTDLTEKREPIDVTTLTAHLKGTSQLNEV